ncbi:MAG TPA: long-chain-fatty-acid--CoA ligase [Allosphingosinicella sp.]
MRGLMQNPQLTVDGILDHARRWHGHREIVSRSIEGPIVRTCYSEVHDRSKRLSSALLSLGIGTGDRVATLAWNSARHLESWYAIMGIGAVCHTLNPRLFNDQIAWIVNHAEDRIVIADSSLVPILEELLPTCPSVEHVIILADEANMPTLSAAPALCSESLIAEHEPIAAWGGFHEDMAAGLCYTSGTTGDPKGVLYSHRSNYLHTLTTVQRDVLGLSTLDVVMPIVPMFHANAWGLAFSCPAVGAKMVLPGDRMDGGAIHELMESEGVTFSAAVPTVWQMLLQHLDETGARLSTLKRVAIGGSAVPEAVVRTFNDKHGIEVVHAWGMTEASPLGAAASLIPEIVDLPFEQQLPWRLKQGRPPLGVELKLSDDEGNEKARDGRANGRLMVRGLFIVKQYFKGAGGRILDQDGYFDTGDVATIDRYGFVQITDRSKDVIKSGGEWISSIEIENLAACHPKAARAAVIGISHPKWGERPLLLVRLRVGETATREEFQAFLHGKIAKWWMPDEVLFVDDIPLGATGKIDKKLIRKRFADYVFPDAAGESRSGRDPPGDGRGANDRPVDNSL